MQNKETIRFANGLTITLTGPQGCGKSLVTHWLRSGLPAHIWTVTGPVIASSWPGADGVRNRAPTFDDWYAARHNGSTFDHDHMQDGAWIATAMKTLAQFMREYITEVAQGAHHG